MKKKLVTMMLTLSMAAGLLTGCGKEAATDAKSEESVAETAAETEKEESAESSTAESDTEEGTTSRISEETITLTVAGQYNNGATSDWNATQQFQEYEKRLGIKLDATTYDTETWKSKLTLLAASDELPDLIANAGMSVGQVAEYGNDGYFLDFSEYLDIMPNLVAIMEEYPQYEAAIKDEEGHIYAFPQLNNFIDPALSPQNFINKSWLENLELEVPKTLDDLYNVLTAFKEQDANGNGDPNDEIPFGLAYQGGSGYFRNEMYVLFAHGIYSQNYVYHLMAGEDGKVVLGDTTENYRDFLKYMNTLYSEGLINEDAYVLTPAELKTLVEENRVGISGVSESSYNALGDMGQYYQNILGYTSEYSPNTSVALSSRVSGSYVVAASSDTEYPEEIAKFVDYLFTPEGSISALNGYEGVTFDYKMVNGSGVIDHTNYAEGYESPELYRIDKAIASGAFQIVSNNEGTIWQMIADATPEELEAGEVYETHKFGCTISRPFRDEGVEVHEAYPRVKYTDEELKERTTIFTDIDTYLRSAKAEFIIGKRDVDADWDAHLATLKEMKLDRLMEIEQAAYDRYLSTIK